MDAKAELLWAIRQLNHSQVKKLLKSKKEELKAARCTLHAVIRNFKNERNRETPESLEIIQELLAHGVGVNEKDDDLKTPLVVAMEGLLESRSKEMFYLHERCITLLEEWGATYGDDGPLPKGLVVTNSYYGMSQCPKVMAEVLNFDKDALKEALQEENASDPMALTQLTPLHVACRLGDKDVIEVLLNAGADPGSKDAFGLTPLLIASAMGLPGCLSLLTKRSTPDAVNRKADGMMDGWRMIDPPPRVDYLINMPHEVLHGTTCLHEAVKVNNSKCVEILLEKGADAGATDSLGKLPLQLAGTTKVDCTSVQYLGILDSLLQTNTKMGDTVLGIALLNALNQNCESAVHKLLEGGAKPWVRIGDETPLHVAASSGLERPLEMFIGVIRNVKAINILDGKNRTALHRAADNGHAGCVSVLIRSGANLSLKDTENISGLEAVILKLPKSVSFFLGEMDHWISCKERSCNEYSLKLCFRIFTQIKSGRQTDLINSLLQSTLLDKKVKSIILEHPLVDTFCAIKWNKARYYFFLVVILHFLYVVSLSTFTVFDYYKYSTSSWTSFFRYIHMFFATLVLINATSLPDVNYNIKILWRRKAEVTTLIFCAALSIVWAFATIFIDSDYLHLTLLNGWGRKVLLFLLPLTWLALMLMIGRYRAWGWRALLFGLVFKNTILTLGVLCFLLVGFSLSFFVAFKPLNVPLFDNPWMSMQTTFVMMTGEYNYNDLSQYLGFYTRLLFILFVVVATLVINNLVVALAVKDANELSQIGESRCLKKKLEFVYSFEVMSNMLASRVMIEDSYVFEVKGSEEIGYKIRPRLIPKRILDCLMKKALENPAEEIKEPVSEEKRLGWDSVISLLRKGNKTEASSSYA